MNKSKQVKTKLETVKAILTNQPETRDDDRKLIAEYWRSEQELLFRFGTAEQVLRQMVNKHLTLPDDITRARRKVQENTPALKGRTAVQKQRADDEEDMRMHFKGTLI